MSKNNILKVIDNKILKTELIEWRRLEWFQGNLKEAPPENVFKLIESLVTNDFIDPFKVWFEKRTKKLWILDGHYRKYALEKAIEKGIKVQDKYSANFIDLKNRKEAAQAVLVYTTQYARLSNEGLYEFYHKHELDIDSLKRTLHFNDYDLKIFENGYLRNTKSEDNPNKSFEDIYEIVVECNNEKEQESVYNNLIRQGYKCRVLTL